MSRFRPYSDLWKLKLPERVRITIFAVLLLFASACGGQKQDAAGNIEIIDDLDRIVSLERSPERLVTLAPNLTEIVFASGHAEHLVAVTTADDFPPAVNELPSFSALPLDLEALSVLQPDLVLATDHVNDVRAAGRLDALGIPSLYFHFDAVSDVFRVMRVVCDMFASRCPAADSLQALWSSIPERDDPGQPRPSVLLLAGDDVLYSFGAQSYTEEMIEAAGGLSVTRDRRGQASVLSEEFVLATRPEVIVLTMGTDYDTSMLLQRHPAWDVVPAIAQSHVYSVDADYFVRPGPRLVEGTVRLKQILARVSNPR
jgi:iron complex transport system substrate-binding protein